MTTETMENISKTISWLNEKGDLYKEMLDTLIGVRNYLNAGLFSSKSPNTDKKAIEELNRVIRKCGAQ